MKLTFILRGTFNKIFAALLCLAMVTVVNFLLPRLMPGDPVLMLTGMDEASVSPAQHATYTAALGLDKPLLQQFASYAGGLLRGDLGYSYHLKSPVGTLIASRLPATLQLALPALLLSSLLAILLGSLCGGNADGRLDRTVTTTMISLDAVPAFLLAMLAVWWLGFVLGWLPLGGLSSTIPPTGLRWLWDRVVHLTLPVLVITLGSLPAKFLLVRTSVAAEMSKPYPAYALARGVPRSRVLLRHVFPSVCQPFVAMLGLGLGFVLAGSVVVEGIFSISGMGGLLHRAITTRDLPTMQGCLLVTAITVIVATILADLAALLLSPRARYGVYEK